MHVQNDFSLLNRTYESDTWEAAYRFGVVGLPYGALAGGVLTGKYMDGSKWSKVADADRPLAGQHVKRRLGVATACCPRLLGHVRLRAWAWAALCTPEARLRRSDPQWQHTMRPPRTCQHRSACASLREQHGAAV